MVFLSGLEKTGREQQNSIRREYQAIDIIINSRILSEESNRQVIFLLRAKWMRTAEFDIIIIIDRFYTALLSALEQTHCTRM